MIRVATPNDAKSIAEIQVSSWQAAYAGIMPDEMLAALSVPKREEGWKRTLDEKTSLLFVEEFEEKLVGFVCTGKSRDADKDPGSVAEIYAIYLTPPFYRKGLGAALFEAAVKQLKESGFSEVTLWVLEGNKPGRAFYKKMGMAADGKTKTDVFGGKSLTQVRYFKKI